MGTRKIGLKIFSCHSDGKLWASLFMGQPLETHTKCVLAKVQNLQRVKCEIKGENILQLTRQLFMTTYTGWLLAPERIDYKICLFVPAPVGSTVFVVNDCTAAGSFNTKTSAFCRPR